MLWFDDINLIYKASPNETPGFGDKFFSVIITLGDVTCADLTSQFII